MKTPGQIAREAYFKDGHYSPSWDALLHEDKELWERAAQAVLSSQWRSIDNPIDDPPENETVDVILYGGHYGPLVANFYSRNSDRTHWMYLPDLPKPKELTPEEQALQEFKQKFALKYDLTELVTGRTQVFKFNSTENAWMGFKAGKGI